MFNRSGQFLKWRLLDLVVLLFCVLGDVSGFSAGAGSQSCVNLMPLHSTHQGQEGPVPYVVELTKHTYQPNEQILGNYKMLLRFKIYMNTKIANQLHEYDYEIMSFQRLNF